MGAALDYEADNNIFRLSILVSDLGGNPSPLATRAEVIVRLTDINESPTVASTKMSVQENSQVDVKVGEPIFARDPDIYSRQKLRYEFVGGNDHGIFAINDCSGQIT